MASDSNVITIVTGLPRSGTSLLMRMLEAGGLPTLTDGVRIADADNPHGYYEYEPVKRTRHDASWLPLARGKVVKMVYALVYELPPENHYRVLFMERQLDEILASQRVMLQRKASTDSAPGPSVEQPARDAQPAHDDQAARDAQAAEVQTVEDQRLAAVFRTQLDDFLRWIGHQPNFQLLRVNYNELVKDPGPNVARIRDFTRQDLSQATMMATIDLALYRQRR